MTPSHTSKNTLTTSQKALAINLTPDFYGTIVEIGAAQEVAGNFFKAGAAAGSIAKTMSAYDMQFSDQIYGKAGRYVSGERLSQMLKHEYQLVIDRLQQQKGQDTRFFAYAATIAAKSYGKDNYCHGHIGIRFQRAPKVEHSDIVMHVHMLDKDAKLQAEALGILGVNAIYGAYHLVNQPDEFIETLLDNLSSERIEVDYIEFRGEAFQHIENRLMNLQLIRSWCTRAVLFDEQGKPQIPGNVLRKSPINVIRGSFKPPTKVHNDMFIAGADAFGQLKTIDSEQVVSLAEITMAELNSETRSSDKDFLARVDLLNAMGYKVLISDYYRLFRLRSWLREYTKEPLGITLSVLDFENLFDPSFYEGLEGGILEAMGKLFPDNTHVFVYPSMVEGTKVTLDNVRVEPTQKFLLKYLVENNLLRECKAINEENLLISARKTYEMIRSNDNKWQDNVIVNVKELIVERSLFK